MRAVAKHRRNVVLHRNSAYAQAVLADSPTVYYRLGETSGTSFVDSANGHNMTMNGTLTPQTSLLASDQDGAQQMGPSNGSVAFQLGATLPITVEFWAKPSSLSADSQLVSCGGGAPRGWGCGYLNTTGHWFWINNGILIYNFATSAVVGTKAHVVMRMNAVSTDCDLYVNGAFAQTIAGSGMIAPTTENLCIGKRSDGFNSANSVLDEVAIYPTLLSAGRIAAHYAAA